MSEEKVREIVRSRGLPPLQQKRLWARTTLIKQLLVKMGVCTSDDFDAKVDEMVGAIDDEMAKNVRKDLGLD